MSEAIGGGGAVSRRAGCWIVWRLRMAELLNVWAGVERDQGDRRWLWSDRGLISGRWMGARARASDMFRAAIFFSSRLPFFQRTIFTGRLFKSSVMSNVSFTSCPLGTAMVGGAIAMAILEIPARTSSPSTTRRESQDGRPELPRQCSHGPWLPRRRQDHRGDQGHFCWTRARPVERTARIRPSLQRILPGFHF